MQWASPISLTLSASLFGIRAEAETNGTDGGGSPFSFAKRCLRRTIGLTPILPATVWTHTIGFRNCMPFSFRSQCTGNCRGLGRRTSPWRRWRTMSPVRTTVVMQTDISGSTARFRHLLAADLQPLLSEHRDFLARHAAEHDGRIMKGAGDGYWLEFPSVTGAAKAAIAMQESL